MGKGTVLFDIDRTIFDTDKASLGHNKKILEILNTDDLEKVKKAKDDYKATLANEREYKPEEYLKLLSERFNFPDLQSLIDIYYAKEFEFIYKEAVFPETIPLLEKLKDIYILGIYSEGSSKFQKHKFRALDLNSYFEDDMVFIQDAKDIPEAVAKIPKGSVVVDDKRKICKFLTDNGIRAIWLNKTDDPDSSEFETVHSLLELPQILL